MGIVKDLQAKIKLLEEKVKNLEGQLDRANRDSEWMAALYQAAKQIVIKEGKASVISLQKKLIIDYQRAVRLMEELEANGIIGSDDGSGKRKVLTNNGN